MVALQRFFHTHRRRVAAGGRHLYYACFGDPRSSEWTEIPARLYNKEDASLPQHLYAKAQLRDIIDGVGRKPRDVPPEMTTAQMLIYQQRRTNQKAVTP